MENINLVKALKFFTDEGDGVFHKYSETYSCRGCDAPLQTEDSKCLRVGCIAAHARELVKENRTFNVSGYKAPGTTELFTVAENLTEEDAIVLADRLSRIFGLECFHAEKI